jgi:capsular polysaccharide biosynthesis protein
MGGFRVLTLVQQAIARALRAIPGSQKLFGLPSRRIRSLKKWTEHQRSSLDWMQKCKGPYYEKIFESVAISRHQPRNALDRPQHHAFTVERYHVHNEVYLARIPRGRVLGPDGTVITPDGGIVEESSWGMGWLERDRSLTAVRLPAPEFRPGAYFTPTRFSEGFADWVLDTLPRFYSLARLPTDEVRILVNKPLNSWQRESLELLGIDLSRIEVLENRYIEAEILYFPSFVGDPGNEHPAGMGWLRDRLIENSEPRRRPNRRLYISRRLALRRRILNEDELQPILRAYGFEIVETELLSFRQQIDLLSEAEAVVALHGAGLSNIVFAPKGCKVVEIFDPDHVKVMYWALADVLDQEYWYYIAHKAGAVGIQHQVTGHDDVVVLADEFSHSLERVFAQSTA